MKTLKFYQCPTCGAILFVKPDGTEFWVDLNVLERSSILLLKTSETLSCVFGKIEVISSKCDKCLPPKIKPSLN